MNDIPHSAKHEHLGARDVMVEVPDARAGTMHVTGRVIKFNRSGMPVGHAPTIGEHTDEILTGLLGKSEEEIANLREAGAV